MFFYLKLNQLIIQYKSCPSLKPVFYLAKTKNKEYLAINIKYLYFTFRTDPIIYLIDREPTRQKQKRMTQ